MQLNKTITLKDKIGCVAELYKQLAITAAEFQKELDDAGFNWGLVTKLQETIILDQLEKRLDMVRYAAFKGIIDYLDCREEVSPICLYIDNNPE